MGGARWLIGTGAACLLLGLCLLSPLADFLPVDLWTWPQRSGGHMRIVPAAGGGPIETAGAVLLALGLLLAGAGVAARRR